MGFFDRIFNKKARQGERITQIGRIVAEEVNQLVDDVYTCHKSALLAESLAYVVPAIWGTGNLDPVQREIHRQTAPVLRKIFETLNLKGISEEQDYAVAYLVRDLVITKLTQRIQIGKHPGLARFETEEKDRDRLYNMVPLGNA